MVTLAISYYARRYMFADKTEYLRLQVKMLVPFIVSLGFFFLHRYLESSFGLRGFTGISLAAQVVVWGLIIIGFYRDYLSSKEIKALVANIKDTLRSGKAER